MEVSPGVVASRRRGSLSALVACVGYGVLVVIEMMLRRVADDLFWGVWRWYGIWSIWIH